MPPIQCRHLPPLGLRPTMPPLGLRPTMLRWCDDSGLKRRVVHHVCVDQGPVAGSLGRRSVRGRGRWSWRERATSWFLVVSTGWLLAACGPDSTEQAPRSDQVEVQAGTGGFAMLPPRRGGQWWATFAFPVCRNSTKTLTLTSADLTGSFTPQQSRYVILTYADTGDPQRDGFTRGGFLKGLPTQVERNGTTYIDWGGDLTAGTVTDVNGTEVGPDCEASPTELDQWVAVSMRADSPGVAADSLQLAFSDGDSELTTAPTEWLMIACGNAVSRADKYVDLC